jgi:hypothetical protein
MARRADSDHSLFLLSSMGRLDAKDRARAFISSHFELDLAVQRTNRVAAASRPSRLFLVEAPRRSRTNVEEWEGEETLVGKPPARHKQSGPDTVLIDINQQEMGQTPLAFVAGK